jgi:hypothetical protein
VQTHDFNPGLDNNLFWTIPMSFHSVSVDLDAHQAELKAEDVDVEDYGNIVNALNDENEHPAIASFHVKWSGHHKSLHVHDDKRRFRGTYSIGKATIAWHATRQGFFYRSDPATTSVTESAFMGRERNGVFFAPSKGCRDC